MHRVLPSGGSDVVLLLIQGMGGRVHSSPVSSLPPRGSSGVNGNIILVKRSENRCRTLVTTWHYPLKVMCTDPNSVTPPPQTQPESSPHPLWQGHKADMGLTDLSPHRKTTAVSSEGKMVTQRLRSHMTVTTVGTTRPNTGQ